MISAAIQGLILGLILSIPVSPIFFLLLSTSIEKGVKNALVLESGIISSDILCVLLIYFGLAAYISKPDFKIPVYLIGGVFLSIYGTVSFFKKNSAGNEVNLQFIPRDIFKVFFKGFFLNISNPAVAVFWLGAVSIAITQFHNISYGVAIYFGIAIITVLLFDIFKIVMADYIRKWLNKKHIEVVSRIGNAAMGIFGLYLLVKGMIFYLE